MAFYDLSDGELIALLQIRPVAIAISSVGWENYGGGVFACGINPVIDHAVLLVGYTDQFWIIKNQWGPNWGESGYMRVTRDRMRNCQIGVSAFIMSENIHKFILLAFIALFAMLMWLIIQENDMKLTIFFIQTFMIKLLLKFNFMKSFPFPSIWLFINDVIFVEFLNLKQFSLTFVNVV